MPDSVFSKHHDELEKHETMMGRDRGRLAVAMDLLTDALAMVGQHGVYCQSARHPGKPTMDIAMVLEQISDAKELLQSVIEAERSLPKRRRRRSVSLRTTTCSNGSSCPAREICSAPATRSSDARSPCDSCLRISPSIGRS